MGWCVTELTCMACGASYPGENLRRAEGVWMTCPTCGPLEGILDVGYDLDRIRSAWRNEPLANRSLNHWRYAEVLPLEPAAGHR